MLCKMTSVYLQRNEIYSVRKNWTPNKARKTKLILAFMQELLKKIFPDASFESDDAEKNSGNTNRQNQEDINCVERW